MNDRYDFKLYKEAKSVSPHLKTIIEILNLTYRGLSIYKHFIPVTKVLHVINEQKSILEAHKSKYEKIIKEKGKT